MANRSRTYRIAGVAALLLVVGGLALLGWRWLAGVTCEAVEVAGAHYAAEDALVELAGVDTGMVLVDIDPVLVADRLRRHPWVEEAAVMRLPTGTVTLRVRERTPVALVVGADGAPSHYLDAHGQQMPLAPGAAYDVPLLRGLREPYHPVQPVQHAGVRALLEALARADRAVAALVSELAVQPTGEVVCYTVPAGAQGALLVRLGQDAFAEKLERLHAFWHQAVLPQQHKTFILVDLRFDSQIVTREEAAGKP